FRNTIQGEFQGRTRNSGTRNSEFRVRPWNSFIMHVPLLDLKVQYLSIRDEIRSALDRVMDSQRFILGPEVEAFEREIAAYCRCAHAIGRSSGTDALLAALMVVDLDPVD